MSPGLLLDCCHHVHVEHTFKNWLMRDSPKTILNLLLISVSVFKFAADFRFCVLNSIWLRMALVNHTTGVVFGKYVWQLSETSFYKSNLGHIFAATINTPATPHATEPCSTTNAKSTFVQVMAWCLQAASHYLSQSMSLTLHMAPLGHNGLITSVCARIPWQWTKVGPRMQTCIPCNETLT